MIVRYAILTDAKVDLLEAQVRDFIQHGWQPRGGMAVEVAGPGKVKYHQTMTFAKQRGER